MKLNPKPTKLWGKIDASDATDLVCSVFGVCAAPGRSTRSVSNSADVDRFNAANI